MEDKEEISFQKRPVLKFNMEADLEKALDLAGTGKYQVLHCSMMVATLSSALLEMIGCSFILPAAACDLGIPDNLRGILASLPNIGVILSAPLWGRAADTLGRKPVLLASSAAAGVFGLLAAFTPNILCFGLCKLAGSFFLSCPSSLGFAYAGELMPKKRRDFAVLMCNGLLTLSASLSPIFAWGVLSCDWSLGPLAFKSWRVLTALYATPLVLAALWITQARESPKFLMAKGKPEQALEVLRHIYAMNSGLVPERFCVSELISSLEDSEGPSTPGINCDMELKERPSLLALLRPPHVKWLALTGFLMFGLFSVLNGLFLFAPDTINKIMVQPSEQTGNLCALMNQAENKTSTNICVDDISYSTFHIMVVSGVLYGTVVLALSFSSCAKRMLLISMFLLVGLNCLVSEITENRIVAGVAMSTLQVTALGIGPLTAYAVHLFPTSLRKNLFSSPKFGNRPGKWQLAWTYYMGPEYYWRIGMMFTAACAFGGTAVGAVLMLGRVGSVAGSNIAGALLRPACAPTVYGFSGLLFLCAGLSFLLPKDKTSNIR